MSDNFYGINIETPLSVYNNTSEWDNSPLGKLHAKTNGQVSLVEVPREYWDSEYYWRIVYAYWSTEDSLITYFKAYNLIGDKIDASFGITHNKITHPVNVAGFMNYPFEGANAIYIPVNNNFQTQNTGGYTVYPLPELDAVEGLAFGNYRQGNNHQCLVIGIRKFKRGTAGKYPNDILRPKVMLK